MSRMSKTAGNGCWAALICGFIIFRVIHSSVPGETERRTALVRNIPHAIAEAVMSFGRTFRDALSPAPKVAPLVGAGLGLSGNSGLHEHRLVRPPLSGLGFPKSSPIQRPSSTTLDLTGASSSQRQN